MIAIPIAALLLIVAGSLVKWYCHPWRCWGFDIFWNYPDREGDEIPAFRLIWCGWFTIVHDTSKGWRGWYVMLFTD